MDSGGEPEEARETEEQPHAECSTRPNSQPAEGASDAKKSEQLHILLETREKRGLPRKKKSECNCQQSRNSLETSSAITHFPHSPSGHSISSHVFHSSLSCGSTISSIGSARLTESQTSGYTTESSYQTAAARDSTLTYSNYDESYRRALHSVGNNQIEEIHVGLDGIASGDQIQAIYHELRNLLSNEIELIRVLSDGNREAVYVIAYSLM